MNESTTDCKTTLLKDGSKLDWQFNCDKIWLTLEFKNGKKEIIDTVPIEYYDYTFRLGYHLFKEFANSLLFRSGCPANGPCNFVLLDKSNGKKISEFGELIYDHETGTIYDFILYLSSKDILTIHYIDTNKKYKIKIDSKQINSVVPEYMFHKISINGNLLTLDYGNKELILDLKKYSR
ncbi:MAG: hypothetical protein ACHQET_03935 [Chitinophagales bacterium]